MAELVEAVTSTSPDGFTPRVIKQTDDYLAVEYESPTFGFIDDFEVLFSSQRPGEVEYRSASRIGEVRPAALLFLCVWRGGRAGRVEGGGGPVKNATGLFFDWVIFKGERVGAGCA
jgi:hypothetical protein